MPADWAAIIRTATQMLQEDAESHGVDWRLALPPDPVVVEGRIEARSKGLDQGLAITVSLPLGASSTAVAS